MKSFGPLSRACHSDARRRSAGIVPEEAVMKLRASAITLAALAVACTKEPVSPKPVGPQPPPPITALPRALTSQEQSLIAADNRFAIKLLKQANADTRDTLPNLFVSPLSVAMALGMTYNGAAGTTEDAMRTTL